MAGISNSGRSATLRLNSQAQDKIVKRIVHILDTHKKMTELRSKYEAIDKAYARYKETADEAAGNTKCGDVFAKDNVVSPIVVSQVDSYVAYLAEVFLSGSPLFPVVSSPRTKTQAEALETLLDEHATLAGYPRQLLLFIRNGVKYNIGALEADWDSLSNFNIVNSYLDDQGRTVTSDKRYLTVLRNLDMYNTVWDTTVAPGDVSAEGDFAGYVEKLTRTKLYKLLSKLKEQEHIYNMADALDPSSSPAGNHYHHRPQISSYTGAESGFETSWDEWFEPGSTKRAVGGSKVELCTMYMRIVPRDYGIITAGSDQMQIWQFRVLNASKLISARRIISAYDRLPILFGQPLEDGMDYQTQSVAEMQIPIQSAASTMFNVRFSAARRAVGDRALYDPEVIDPNDVNSPTPAPKIPVKLNPLAKKTMEQAYKQLPFDLRGTESAFQDVAALVDFSKQLSGVNSPRQGQFQRGNKSVQEWNDTMGGSDNRLRLAALCLEHQVFVWLKFILLLNIYQYGKDETVVSQRTGEEYKVSIADLRQHVMSFRVADGYTPKSKLASSDMIVQGMTMIMNSPQLQQIYGAMLGPMFAHLMQLGGVRGLEQYLPQQPTEGAPGQPLATPPAIVPDNTGTA